MNGFESEVSHSLIRRNVERCGATAGSMVPCAYLEPISSRGIDSAGVDAGSSIRPETEGPGIGVLG